MRLTTMLWLGFAAVVLAGCGHDAMHEGMASMQEQLDGARVENARHDGVVQAALSLPEVMAELAVHEQAMAGTMSHMDGAMGMMSHCAGGGMAAMMDVMQQMRAAMPSHRAAMEATGDLDGAKAEVRRHSGVVVDMMAMMEKALPDAGCM